MTIFERTVRFAIGFTLLGIGGVIWILSALAVFPSHRLRARVSNFWGRVLAVLLLGLTKSSFTVHHRERLQGPAIFVSNHTSLVDILIAAWLIPSGTIALGKREILRYPIVGGMFFLSGSVAVDRNKQRNARGSTLEVLAQRLKKNALGVVIWPEGTRSADGTLGTFRKGFAHLAQETQLDVVPIVVHNAWRAWPRKSLKLSASEVVIEVLAPISASTLQNTENADAAVKLVRDKMQVALVDGPPLPEQPELRPTTGNDKQRQTSCATSLELSN